MRDKRAAFVELDTADLADGDGDQAVISIDLSELNVFSVEGDDLAGLNRVVGLDDFAGAGRGGGQQDAEQNR